MDSVVFTSLIVSCIAISVIFIVLIILIYTIKLLVNLIPYEEFPASKSAARTTTKNSAHAVTPDIISAITAVMATHLEKSPQQFHITQIIPK